MGESLAFGELLVAALRSMGEFLTLAFAGFYLSKRGFLTVDNAKVLSRASMQVAIPALLFTSVLDCSQNWSAEPCPSLELGSAWPLLVLPLVNMSVGLCLGWVVTRVAPPPENFKKAAIAAVAFGNSTGLPITLLAVVHTAFSSKTKLGRVDPAQFLSVYLLTNPLVQWTVGGRLLGLADKPAPAAAPPPSERSGLLNTAAPANGGDGADAERPRGKTPPPPVADDAEQPVCGAEAAVVGNGASNEGCWARWARRPAVTKIADAANAALQPPTVAALLAFTCVLVPGVRSVFVDVNDRDDDAPLEWMFDAFVTLGKAAVPLNMFVLGSSFARGADFSTAPKLTLVLMAVAKLIIMPGFGVATATLMHRYFGLDYAIDASMLLVVMVVTATPTANTIMVMATAAGQDAKALAASILAQYMIAPITLTLWLTLFISMTSKY